MTMVNNSWHGGPPRAPGWPETDSPRKTIANSGVGTQIRALGAHFVAIFVFLSIYVCVCVCVCIYIYIYIKKRVLVFFGIRFFCFYIQSFWLNMLQCNRGCVYVCMCVYMYVCVCVCVTALQPKRMDGFWWNFPQMIWQIFARSVFLRFWNFQTMTSWRPFLHFFVRALSQSQFCSDFLQNWWRGRKLSSAVCYWKSARSVGKLLLFSENFPQNRLCGLLSGDQKKYIIQNQCLAHADLFPANTSHL